MFCPPCDCQLPAMTFIKRCEMFFDPSNQSRDIVLNSIGIDRDNKDETLLLEIALRERDHCFNSPQENFFRKLIP